VNDVNLFVWGFSSPILSDVSVVANPSKIVAVILSGEHFDLSQHREEMIYGLKGY
jgi:hypothetical protein